MKRLVSIIFSRYTLSALLIICEIGLIVFMGVRLSSYSLAFLVSATLINIFVIIRIINAEMNPEYRVTWITVVFLFPGLGVLLYLLFHKRVMSKKQRRLGREIVARLDECADEPEALESLASVDRLAAGKALAILGLDPTAEVYRDTDSRYYARGEEMYADMLSAISGAERFIFLEYFIIDEGEMWQGIYDILRQKAREGVEVRVMYDDIGSLGRVPKDFYSILERDGIRAGVFAKATPSVTVAHNHRDHRKILVVDGVVGFTGGVNIADEYINKKDCLGYWKDGGVRLIGSGVRGLTTLFLTLWDINGGITEEYSRYLVNSACEGEGYYIPFGSGPAPLYEGQVGKRAFLDVINQAERYVYITTPYLIIDYDLTEALIGAAGRGVDVRIITPYKADKRFVKTMTKSAYPHLIEGGVKIYEYTPGFMHHKTLVSDDKYAIVGTINLDYRSLVHHFEDAVWMYGSSSVISVREDFMRSVADSHRMELEECRLGLGEWLVKCGLRLFAPLL